jgi:protein SCO1/2
MSWRGKGLHVALLALSLAAGPSPADRAPRQVTGVTAGWPIGDFALVDQDDNPFLRRELDGRWTLLVVGDSQCPSACAAALSATAGLLRRIAGTQTVKTTQVVLLSLRPGDTAADMRRRVALHGGGLIGLTGPSRQLAGLADDLGIGARSPAEQASNMPDQRDPRGSIWLIGPDGVVRAELLPPFDVKLLTATYLKTRLRG